MVQVNNLYFKSIINFNYVVGMIIFLSLATLIFLASVAFLRGDVQNYIGLSLLLLLLATNCITD